MVELSVNTKMTIIDKVNVRAKLNKSKKKKCQYSAVPWDTYVGSQKMNSKKSIDVTEENVLKNVYATGNIF